MFVSMKKVSKQSLSICSSGETKSLRKSQHHTLLFIIKVPAKIRIKTTKY